MTRLGTLVQIGRSFGARDGMLRLGYELQRGSGLLSRRMRSVQGWGSWELRRLAPNHSPEELSRSRLAGERPFFFADARALAPELKKIVDQEREKLLVAEAERILAGNLPYFGRLSFECGFPPRWFENPANGQQVSPQRPWTTMRFASADYGDLKFILEPSRFLFSYPLARAYAITGDQRFAEAFWVAVEDWARQSPPMSGPLWVCGQESALRIMAWSFALHAFVHSPATTPSRLALLLSMIAAHAWRTEQTVGYARSQRSNHLFSEAAGLWTAGTLYPELKQSKRWQAQGAELLREAVLDQITPAGAYLQHSFNYQRMVLYQLLWTIRLAELYNVKLHADIHARAGVTLEFLGNFVGSESGRAPNYGSNDGSHVLPLSSCEYGDYRPLMQLGSCVLKRERALESGPWDELPLWLCGRIPSGGQTRDLKPVSAETGYHRIGGKSSWALVRAGAYERRPFQADQLHVDLWWQGLNIARDAGTYLYNGDPPWDNGLAGTAVHNTVTVDGRDQMRRAGRFLWIDWAQAHGRTFSTGASGPPDRFEGEHDGYRSLGVRHRRSVQYLAEEAWVVVDDLVGEGEHEAQLHWLLPDLPLDVVSWEPLNATQAAGHLRATWTVFSSAPGNACLVRAGKSVSGDEKPAQEAVLGWESPTYGELRPALSLVYHVRGRLPVRMVTAVLLGQALQLRLEGSQITLLRDASRIYEISLTPGSTAGFVADREAVKGPVLSRTGAGAARRSPITSYNARTRQGSHGAVTEQ